MSPLRPFTKIRTGSTDLERIQTAFETTARSIIESKILDGNLIEDVVVKAVGGANVSHKLDKPYTGWIVVKQNANANVWETRPTNNRTSILLNSSADVTISLWVF